MSTALRDLELGDGLRVPAHLVTQRFARSGGKGGQNVNKVETKVELRLDLAGLEPLLGRARLARLRTNLARRIAADGALRVRCDVHRTRGRNLAEALARMERILAEALVESPARRATRPTRASQERRLSDKQRRSDRKRQRAGDFE